MKDPRVGHIVWFHAGGHETVMQSDQPLPAIVTYVHPHLHADGKSALVNLAVFGKEGSLWSRPSIHLWDGDGEAPARGSFARLMDDTTPMGATMRDDHMPNRQTGEGDDAYRARVAKWQSEHMDERRASQAAMDARGNMDHGPPAPGLPNPALQGTQWDPDMPANTKAKADAKAAKADAEAKAKADIEAKRKAEGVGHIGQSSGEAKAWSDTPVKPMTQPESDQASYKKWQAEQKAREDAARL